MCALHLFKEMATFYFLFSFDGLWRTCAVEIKYKICRLTFNKRVFD